MAMGRGAAGGATVVGGIALYFLLAGDVSVGEAIGCAITLAIAGPYGVAVARTATVPMVLPGRALRALLGGLAAIPADLWRVGRVLAQAGLRGTSGLEGSVKHVPFRFGAFDPADIGRRAAVGVAMSLAPNGIVLGMDRHADELLLHQLAEHPTGGDREWPQ